MKNKPGDPLVCALLAVLLTLLPSRAMAADAGTPITGPDMVRILQDIGYKAELDKDGEGDPMIRSKMSGLNTYVYFYDCENGACGSLQLSVALDLKDGTTMDVVNTFNSQKRYARMYLDDERDPYLRFDFEVLHTDHAAHIASQIDMWETLLASFMTATGYHGDGDEDDDRDAAGPAQGTSGASSLQ